MEKEDKEGSDKTFYIAIAIIACIILVIIIVPRFFEREDPIKTFNDLVEDTIKEGETEDRRIYNGFVFIKEGNLWYSQVQNPDTNELYKFGVRFNPYQVENVTIEGNVDESFRTGRVYITFDPHDEELTYVSLAAAELTLNLARAMGIKVLPACMSEHPACVNISILSCNSTDQPVIEIINDPETKLTMDGNCMKVQGTEFELLKVIDRIIFRAYGIMSE